jgi:hypothetical protein
MLLMDRENLYVPGFSHVLSSTDDLVELEALRVRVGAPPQAFDLRGARPHLDLKLEPRERALRDGTVRVFESTRDLLRYYHAARQR